jgi:hypothetical protein
MPAVAELVRTVFVRGTRVVCDGQGEGPYARFEGRIAAAHEDVLHLNLVGDRNADHVCMVGDDLTLTVSAPHGRFSARGQRIYNVVPGGITLRLKGAPTRIERRDYLRVRCHLTVSWELLREEDVAERAAALIDGRPTTGAVASIVSGVTDPTVARIIAELEARIGRLEEAIARLVATQDQEDKGDTVIDISGSGMRILSKSSLRLGDTVEATVRFQPGDGREVRLIAQVVRVEPPNYGRTSPRAAFRFLHIDGKDREFVIRYTFREHRRQLRESLV